MRRLLALLLVASSCSAGPVKPKPGQKIPDQKRVLEIQHALVDHHYLPKEGITGKWDIQTTDSLRKIATEHCWQTRHAPDARVLILLGLSKGDPEVTKHSDHLDYLKGVPEYVPPEEVQ